MARSGRGQGGVEKHAPAPDGESGKKRGRRRAGAGGDGFDKRSGAHGASGSGRQATHSRAVERGEVLTDGAAGEHQIRRYVIERREHEGAP